MSTTYLMLKDAEGYPDGVTLTTYTKGEVYDLPDVLATAWVNDKVCAESHKEVTEILEVIDPHTVGSYPPADAQDAHHDLERGQTDAEAQHVNRLRDDNTATSTVQHTSVEDEENKEEEDKEKEKQQQKEEDKNKTKQEEVKKPAQKPGGSEHK